ncbi:aminomethyl-transferring glycine dehydrogenase [Afipia felis]|uniref:Glycine dehydrogenase (decarboxylating) n=2 Tax=Afipia felis TaxID=1035 RepID=A0A380W5Y9_AFIFE|nr:aminomethyl-transferring glycine dehydrogenase [Afipia felis]EKS27602.1 glycine dehydrogenase [Afipia felis ATCC 53690]SUU76311.1 Glycine dehydrogenase [decarboxylating] [Afipia felis]SUU84378.1 Glycine dehydrogenase [decarboxylating] [Afipia felis]
MTMHRPANEPATTFGRRHIGPSPRDIEAMLETAGASSLDALISETLPADIRLNRLLDLPPALSEADALAHMRELAAQNRIFTSLIGQGYSGTQLPTVILRNILENPAWYTAYTPYQPEISQGRLEALFNFQTMICDLTGLDVANASLLDEATAAAEAMALAERSSSVKAKAFFVDRNVHPQTLAVLRTRAEPLGWTLIVGDPLRDLDSADLFGALFQYPGTDGAIRDFRPAIAALHAKGGVAVVAADILALTLLAAPGELGADIAIGSTQRFGVPMGYGGPHAAYMAVKDALKRSLPGRLVGLSVDSRGQPAYRLALQTREQHIRREKATSNICTAQVLLAIISSMYAVYHGPEGLVHIARTVHRRAATLASGLRQLGFAPLSESFFDTVTVKAEGAQRADILSRAQTERLNFRVAKNEIGLALDETTTPATIEAIWRAFGGALDYAEVERETTDTLPSALLRNDTFLTHPVFHAYRSETELLRYMRKLSDRDLALDRAMIPLGSCTMKLNATTEMIPLTWPEFGNIHPFAPTEQAAGYHALFARLEQWLEEITGYDAVSLQPNSGAQGEYAGLLAIRAYYAARDEAQRDVCLIPASAHGTNPASASMAGMKVVVVACDTHGNVDVADLRKKAEAHADTLAAIMITYPSTHGVFEEAIREICDIVHAHGGQVYLDGANLNAQVGLARPGDYGADVSHLNLHKTFCIPHGGGGPGMGPIGVKKHLAPFLPPLNGEDIGAVSAAPYGSASILTISYLYILMMGADGLHRATEVAILNANYIAKRLDAHFPVLYRNHNGRVAHECIIDPRPLKTACGATVDDIAKRLIDYGFHAPTMSFPVPGTLMIEPTESESKAELDRFCEAMIAIRQEIAEVEDGKFPIDASPLRYAPHTVHDIADDNWQRPYSRAEGCFPDGSPRQDKYWSPVGRVDNVYGDRNLVCSCPPVSDYAQAAE